MLGLPHPCPSPAKSLAARRNYSLAGEGSVRERGQSPLSKPLPLFKQKNLNLPVDPFGEGDKGVRAKWIEASLK
jgi:hypothetical protein